MKKKLSEMQMIIELHSQAFFCDCKRIKVTKVKTGIVNYEVKHNKKCSIKKEIKDYLSKK